MENKTFSKDIGNEILLLIDSIELKLMKKKLEEENEKECSTSFNDRN